MTEDSSQIKHQIIRQSRLGGETMDDSLAVEEPLEIRLGYTDRQHGRRHKSVSITMRTPGQDKALALGFLFNENILTHLDQLDNVDDSRPNVIRIELNQHAVIDLSRLERHFYTTSSCGICGKASLEALSIKGLEPIAETDFHICPEALYQMASSLRQSQPLFASTGGNHGVGLFNMAGKIERVMEDVGRHNAMDKLIGECFLERTLPLRHHGILVSGRASFELMQKALMAGAPMLAAVGAPSSLAVELAEDFNMTLVGFLGAERFNIYHGAQRIR
jgi:FdhD protein